MNSYNVNKKTHPYDLIQERLKAYPQKAKYIQLEKAAVEDLLNEFEQIESELMKLHDDNKE